jgi:hypothetical protein
VYTNIPTFPKKMWYNKKRRGREEGRGREGGREREREREREKMRKTALHPVAFDKLSSTNKFSFIIVKDWVASICLQT